MRNRSIERVVVALCALAVGVANRTQAQPGAPTRAPAPQGAAAAAAASAPAAQSPDAVPEVPASAATPPPARSTPPPPPPPPAIPSAAACLLGAHDGIEPSDARTIAVVACEALQQAGANVVTRPMPEPEATLYGAAYRIEARRLGYAVILEERFESPIGRVVVSRSLQLNGVEEVPVAAPRIAESLLHGTPIEQTGKVTSLIGQETRSYQKKYGETLFSVGVLGFMLPGDTWAGYGAWGRIYYEAARYAVGIDLRLGGSTAHDGDASLVSLSVGGRYFLNEADISPFAGGGLGIMWLHLGRNLEYDYNSSSSANYVSDRVTGSGVGAFGEVGVEFLREHRTRFDVLLRADAPFFDLENSARKRYRIPIALMASYSFN